MIVINEEIMTLQTEKMKKLSVDIFDFLSLYAKDSASYDPEFDDEEDRFNGPDSSMMFIAAKLLSQGRKPCVVLSDWGSGCYKMNDSEGVKIHASLLERLNEFC